MIWLKWTWWRVALVWKVYWKVNGQESGNRSETSAMIQPRCEGSELGLGPRKQGEGGELWSFIQHRIQQIELPGRVTGDTGDGVKLLWDSSEITGSYCMYIDKVGQMVEKGETIRDRRHASLCGYVCWQEKTFGKKGGLPLAFTSQWVLQRHEVSALELKGCGFKSWLFHLGNTACHWANWSTSLCLSFYICKITHLRVLQWGLNELIYVKCLEPCLVRSKHSINIIHYYGCLSIFPMKFWGPWGERPQLKESLCHLALSTKQVHKYGPWRHMLFTKGSQVGPCGICVHINTDVVSLYKCSSLPCSLS